MHRLAPILQILLAQMPQCKSSYPIFAPSIGLAAYLPSRRILTLIALVHFPSADRQTQRAQLTELGEKFIVMLPSLSQYGLQGPVKVATSRYSDGRVESLHFLQDGALERIFQESPSEKQRNLVPDVLGRFFEVGAQPPLTFFNVDGSASDVTFVPTAYRSFSFMVNEIPEGIAFLVTNVDRIEDSYSPVGKRIATDFYDPEGLLSSRLTYV